MSIFYFGLYSTWVVVVETRTFSSALASQIVLHLVLFYCFFFYQYFIIMVLLWSNLTYSISQFGDCPLEIYHSFFTV